MAAYCPLKKLRRDTIRLSEVIVLLFGTLGIESCWRKLVLSGSWTLQDSGGCHPRLRGFESQVVLAEFIQCS